MSYAKGDIQYDINAKNILSDKLVIGNILKRCVKECRDYTPEQIALFIKGTPEINRVPVAPGMTNSPHISGQNTESGIPYEGTYYFDVRFDLNLPGTNHDLLIIFDLEAQKSNPIPYTIPERGIFYCARMLSAESGTVFTGDNLYP